MNKTERVLNEIKLKTGIDVYIFNGDTFYAGTKTPVDLKEKSQINYGNVTVVIEGNGEKERVYLALIKEILIKERIIVETDIVSILKGEVDAEKTERFSENTALPNLEALVILVTLKESEVLEAIEFIKTFVTEKDIVLELESETVAIIKYLDRESREAYRSGKEFCAYLKQSLFEETGVKAQFFVGEKVKGADKLSLSYAQAERAKTLAKTFYLSGGVYDFKEFFAVELIDGLSAEKKKEYGKLILSNEIIKTLSDEELMTTCEAFFDCGLNGSMAAKRLFIHRNTLNYRLDKIYKDTGLDLRNFTDALTFRLAIYFYKLR